MKLLIEINDYEKLKNIAEIAMDGKRRKTKNILLCVTGLLFFASLALMINAISYQKNKFYYYIFNTNLDFPLLFFKYSY